MRELTAGHEAAMSSVKMAEGSLRCATRRAENRAQEKPGRCGRDDRIWRVEEWKGEPKTHPQKTRMGHPEVTTEKRDVGVRTSARNPKRAG